MWATAGSGQIVARSYIARKPVFWELFPCLPAPGQLAVKPNCRINSTLAASPVGGSEARGASECDLRKRLARLSQLNEILRFFRLEARSNPIRSNKRF